MPTTVTAAFGILRDEVLILSAAERPCYPQLEQKLRDVEVTYEDNSLITIKAKLVRWEFGISRLRLSVEEAERDFFQGDYKIEEHKKWVFFGPKYKIAVFKKTGWIEKIATSPFELRSNNFRVVCTNE